MENIKSFIYLNNEHMYSLASQLFEGLVDRYIESEVEENKESEGQKGPIGSGNYMADVLKSQKGKTENKFLHDYLYTQFENELISKGKLLQIHEDIRDIKPYQIVKVKGRMIFNDANEILKTIKEFNNLGETISYMSIYSKKEALEEQIVESTNQIQDRNKRAKQLQKKDSIIKTQVKQYAKENGLYLDHEFLSKLEYAIKFGLDDLFEIQLKLGSLTFSSVLDRDYLKENEKLLTYKLSRLTEAEITLVGIVTQGNNYEISSNDNSEISEPNFKEAFRNMVDKLIDIENVYNGKAKGEVIIDPIAIYLEL